MLSFTSRRPLGADEEFVALSYLLITAGTFQKRPFISGDQRKAMLLESLDFNCYKWQWRILAYVVLPNHYHLVVQTPAGDASRAAHIMQSAHSFSAHHWRRDDPSIRSRIWWNFWETAIDNLNKLRQHINYLHANPVHHGIVTDAQRYRFSSYAEYLAADAATIHAWEKDHPAGRLNVIDSF